MRPAATPDGVTPKRPSPMIDERDNPAALACLDWLAQCSARLVELDPSLDIDSADRIAGYLWSNERLRNMAPASAVEYLFAHPRARPALAA